MKTVDGLHLSFKMEDVSRKVYSTHNTTQHHSDQIVVETTTLELGIRFCPRHQRQSRHVSFVIYQISDHHDGIAMGSYLFNQDEVNEDSSEEVGDTGCYLYWITFDVTNTIQSWLVDSDSNRGIRVQCRHCIDAGIVMMKEKTKLHISDAYVIKAKYLPRKWRRELNDLRVFTPNRTTHSNNLKSHDCYGQRSPLHKQRGRKQRCCRQKMVVNVEEMTGFNFILQPAYFNAHFCQGGCPARYNPISEHSLLQSLMHIRTRHKDRDKRIPRPCCSPKKLLPLEILHLDDDDNTKLRVTHWKNIIVAECGCS